MSGARLLSHRLKGVLFCSWFGHDDITVIDGITPERAMRLKPGSVSLAARIDSAHLYCLRCRRQESFPGRPRS